MPGKAGRQALIYKELPVCLFGVPRSYCHSCYLLPACVAARLPKGLLGPLLFSFPTLITRQMRRIQLLTLVVGSLLAMNNSCKKEDDAQPCPAFAVVETAQIPGLKARITEPIPNVGESNQYTVNSASEYRELFDCSPPPTLDFAKHTLLAGKTKMLGNSHVLTQQVVQTCAGYTYTVQLAPGADPKPGSVVYYVLIPKIALTAKVDFDVQLQLPTTSAQVLPGH